MPVRSVNEQRELASKLKISVLKTDVGQDEVDLNTEELKPKVSLMGRSTKKSSRLGSMKMGMKLDIKSVTSDMESMK
jgi:hypothetical protein